MKFIKKLFEPVLSEKEKFKNVYNKMITEWEELEQKKKEFIDSKASELKIEALNNLQLDLLDAFDILRESMVLELVDDELYKLNKIPGSIEYILRIQSATNNIEILIDSQNLNQHNITEFFNKIKNPVNVDDLRNYWYSKFERKIQI